MMRRAVLSLVLVGALSAAGEDASDDRRRLAAAKADAAQARVRSAELSRAAAVERNAAERARTQERAVAARVQGAEADLTAAAARVRIVDALLVRRRSELGSREVPVARLLGALESFAQRPALAAIAQPGSIDDVVRVRAVLGSVMPVVLARTAALRAQVAETRRLRADAAVAAQALADSRAALVRERWELAALQASHSGRADALRRRALASSDQAIALGEAARDIVDRMDQAGDAAATASTLARLGAPPGSGRAPRMASAYRLPVTGRLATGFGEVSANGVRARGLTFAVAPSAVVTAPAAGVVLFARAFRGYGVVVIVDHGDGWRSAILGLGAASARVGATVTRGQAIGRAETGDAPAVTVELYRCGRPVDIAGLIG